MKSVQIVALIGAVLVVASASWAWDFELPLDLRPNQGQGGTLVVSNGVPLQVGQATDTKLLHVMGPDGKQVAAQFRVLARWWQKDNSIRWVLVSFVREASDGKNPIYKLVGGKAPALQPRQPVKVTETKNAIRINTGAAEFEIRTDRFNLLNKVSVNGQPIVQPDGNMGSVVTDPEGRKYYSSKGTDSVRILEQGPVMVKVMAQGRHVSDEPGAFAPGLYGYEVTMTFWAGKAFCDVEAILTNNSAKPIGEPHFEDWSLLTRLGKGGGDWSMNLLAQAKPREGAVGPDDTVQGGANESALLYQDSVGTEHWKTNLGLQPSGYTLAGTGRPTPPMGQLATFRGYKLLLVKGDERTEKAAGDFARGVANCRTGRTGCTVSPRYFWQQFPSAVEFGGDGVVRMSPFPGEYKEVHWLEDASAKAQEFRLSFYPYELVLGPTLAEPALRSAGRYQTRTFALPSPEHCGAAGALSDMGPYMMHEKIAKPAAEHFSLAKLDKQAFGRGWDFNNAYGWQVFGSNWLERAGVSGTNYEPLATSNNLWMHLLNGHPGRLEYGMRVARHARDVRTYHIEGQDNLAVWTSWQPGYWKNCTIEHWSRLIPGTFGHQTNRHPDWLKHPYARSRFPLPNLEHLNLDEVYDLYCLTGDDRALRCMRTIADHGVALATLSPRPRRVYRKEGWCLRAIARYYDLTGDQRYKPYLKEAMDQIWADVAKSGPRSGGTWYLCIYARGAVTAWLATGDERMRDLALGCADWSAEYGVATQGFAYQSPAKPWALPKDKRGGKHGCKAWAAGYHMNLYGYAYSQTGDKRFLPLFELAYEKNAGTWWLGYFPTAMYMAYGPRPYKIAPSAVTDLAAKADGGSVTLTWTAPGDDGKTGTVSVYQIKYATKPILEFVPHPEKMNTHITFWGSNNVDDEPTPKPVGTRQSYTFKGLKPGKYYFAIKSRDVVPNQSPISNVVSAEIGG